MLQLTQRSMPQSAVSVAGSLWRAKMPQGSSNKERIISTRKASSFLRLSRTPLKELINVPRTRREKILIAHSCPSAATPLHRLHCSLANSGPSPEQGNLHWAYPLFLLVRQQQ